MSFAKKRVIMSQNDILDANAGVCVCVCVCVCVSRILTPFQFSGSDHIW